MTEHSMEAPEKSFDQPQSERIKFINWIKRYQIFFQVLILPYFAVIPQEAIGRGGLHAVPEQVETLIPRFLQP